MKTTKKILLLIIFFHLNLFAQTNYEKGYFITNDNTKTECLIKNLDWKNNPSEITYKLTEDSEKQIVRKNEIKEFAIGNTIKYIRATIKIDRSRVDNNNISLIKESLISEENVLLKVLIEGKANLYIFEDSNLRKYYFNQENTPIEELVYRNYMKTASTFAENKQYQRQLYTSLKCENISLNDALQLKYQKGDLVSFFKKYNDCEKYNYTEYKKTQNEKIFQLNIRPGVNFTSLLIETDKSVPGTFNTGEFTNSKTFRIGLEFELFLPFNNNNWSVIFEPTYQYFDHKKSKTTPLLEDTKIDYSSIELPIGVRRYFPINKKSKIFTNGSCVFDLSNDSNIDFKNYFDERIASSLNFSLGLGYNYLNKFSFEFRYSSNRELLKTSPNFTTEYRNVSFILGYSLF